MTLDEILREIEKADSFVITAHDNPDGDAIGSCLAFATVLKNLGKEKIDVLFKEYPRVFATLPNSDLIRTEATLEEYDMAIVLDCPELKRVHKDYHKYFENAKVTVEVDHHLKNAMFADLDVVNPAAPACAEILVSSFQYMGIEITKEVAACLLTGIITDTGGFRFASTTRETFEFAGWALSKGVNVSKIYKESLMTKSKSQFEAEKLAVDRLEFYMDDKITFTYMTKEDEKNLNIQAGECDGIAGIGVNIEGVEVAIFARERDDGFKLSFRSNNIDVADICMLFGGGGHKLAAGCTIDASLEEVRKAVVEETKKHLQ
ncbi:MAG: bifunctional oligoribonuclease/PAP phosphatase NrnA [Clostridia bacterium]|nr:bifunctional oligoribonuclease/PAP phosphatase NrnA [Clostridia bacterium]